MNRSHSSLAFIIVAVMFAIGSSFVASASAATTYDLISCTSGANGIGNGSANWYAADPNVYWRVDRMCPDGGLQFNTGTAAPQNTTAQWIFNPANGVNITNLKMAIRGGDTSTGVEYSLATCASCPAFAVLPDRDGDSPTVWDIQFPIPESETFVIKARCMQAICAPSQGLKMSNFVITVSDRLPPTTAGLFGSRMPVTDVQTGFGSTWNKPAELAVKFLLTDLGSGVGKTALTIDDEVVWGSLDAGCSTSTPVFWFTDLPCPAHFGFDDALTTADLGDGSHQLTLHAIDAVGNPMTPVSQQFRTDGTPPAEPANVTVLNGASSDWSTTRVVKLGWENTGEKLQTELESGVVLAWYDLRRLDGPENPDPDDTGGNEIHEVGINLPSDGTWLIELWTQDRAGNMSTKAALIVRVDQSQPLAPILTPNDQWIGADVLMNGYEQHWAAPANLADLPSGVCGYVATIDDSLDATPPPLINVPASTTQWRFPAGLPEGLHFMHLRAVSCAGIGSAVSTIAVRVDRAAPTTTIHGLPPAEWSRRPAALNIGASDGRSGVASIVFNVDGGPEQSTPTATASLTVADGRHTIGYHATDAAGNRSPSQTAQVNVDSTAPAARILARDPLRPETVNAEVTDEISGVAGAWLEIRRTDAGGAPSERSWRALSARMTPTSDRTRLTFETLLEDDRLPDGGYALRVVATDVAGNSTTSVPVALQLPVRAKPSLTAGSAPVTKKCVARRGRICQRSEMKVDLRKTAGSRLIEFGERFALVGQLLLPSGAPLAGAALTVFADPTEGANQEVGHVITDAGGRYQFSIPPGPSRTFAVGFRGTPGVMSVKSTTVVGVRAGVSLKVSPRRLRVGRSIWFRGAVRSDGTSIPPKGKLVLIEFWNGGGWSPTVSVLHTDSRGRFSVRFLYTRRLTRPIKVKFHARALEEQGWPYEDSSSKPHTVRIRP